jgi:hypothetical protein
MKLSGVRRFRVDELAKVAAYLGEDPGLFLRPDLEQLLATPRKQHRMSVTPDSQISPIWTIRQTGPALAAAA